MRLRAMSDDFFCCFVFDAVKSRLVSYFFSVFFRTFKEGEGPKTAERDERADRMTHFNEQRVGPASWQSLRKKTRRK